MTNVNEFFNLDYKTFLHLIDNLYDEVWIYDNNYNVIYANKATKRHYGIPPQELVGKNFFNFITDEFSYPPLLPQVYKDKKSYAVRQKSQIGAELLTIAVPLFNDDNEIEYVVMSVRDKINENDLYLTKTINSNPIRDNKKIDILYESKEMRSVMDLVKKISTINATSTIIGESGTGKTMLAKYMHSISPRKDKPFVSINCGSIPHELIESELFGYAKGSFTGANTTGRKGLFESANNGTLLLDEISELPYGAQVKLLHVLQDKEFIPIGSTNPIKVDVKIIAATNKDLKRLVETGGFREDLYYRINVFEVFVPPLRQRKKDIRKLIYYFLNQFGNKYGICHEISDDAVSILCNYSWKGNVRELKHIIERLVVTVEDLTITSKHLPKGLFEVSNDIPKLTKVNDVNKPIDFENEAYDNLVAKYESELINDAYKRFKTTRKIAEHLKISQTRASKLVRKYVK